MEGSVKDAPRFLALTVFCNCILPVTDSFVVYLAG